MSEEEEEGVHYSMYIGHRHADDDRSWVKITNLASYTGLLNRRRSLKLPTFSCPLACERCGVLRQIMTSTMILARLIPITRPCSQITGINARSNVSSVS